MVDNRPEPILASLKLGLNPSMAVADMEANNDWKAKVKEALERTDIMALSTLGDDGAWTCPVQFTYNSQLELSFLSIMDTKHVTNILKDPRVSVGIYKPEPLPGGGNLGLQIKGTARLVAGENETNVWHRFQITPEEIWCFDSQVSHRRKKIDLETYRRKNGS